MNRALARQQMVRQQVRTFDVFDDETLALLNTLKRHKFVPPRYADLAYADTRIPLPTGQEMMAPLVEGRILQALDPSRTDSVLEIGAGSGFLTACLATLADSVLSLELHDELKQMAERNLRDAGILNAEVRLADALSERPEGSYDIVAITGSISQFDENLAGLLKDGGRLFVITGDAPVMEGCLVTRRGDAFDKVPLFETCIKPLIVPTPRSTFRF